MLKNILVLILFIGLSLIFYLQFITPSFSGDEIALGTNIKNQSCLSLLYPADNFQSAPPLYLCVQKLIISSLPFPFWIGIKILSFLVASSILIFVYRIAKINLDSWGYFSCVWMVLFAFNPYVLHNVLTVKQYGFDLLGVLILFTYFNVLKSGLKGGIFFGLWCLFSNVGLFIASAFILHLLLKNVVVRKDFWKAFKNQLIASFPIAVGPLLYVIYFIWFLQQEGAREMQTFMVEYWHWGFFPHNMGFFGFSFMFFRLLGIYFFSSFLIVSYACLIGVFVGLVIWLKNKQYKMHEFLSVALLGALVHFILNMLKLYPLADRLYLYWTPIFYFLLIYLLVRYFAKQSYMAIGVGLILLGLFLTNLPFKANDVAGVYRFLRNEGITEFYTSPKAEEEMGYFNSFTDFYFNENLNHKITVDSSFKSGTYLVSQVNPWYGHKNETAPELGAMSSLITTRKIKLVHRVDGYNIYRVL